MLAQPILIRIAKLMSFFSKERKPAMALRGVGPHDDDPGMERETCDVGPNDGDPGERWRRSKLIVLCMAHLKLP